MSSDIKLKWDIESSIEIAVTAAYRAGLEILEVYDTLFAIELKDDNSPITLADTRAHKVIELALADTNVPVLSEEGRNIPYEERREWKRFWMVDPLDGTKEFLKRNDEFTVNIALIENEISVAGVIYVPVTGVMYFGVLGKGAFKIKKFSPEGNLESWTKTGLRMPFQQKKSKYTVVGSRSHKSPETDEVLKKLTKEHGDLEIINMGSSLKICLVADGTADIYPRYAPTMEWDTAAGHAIAKAAGKDIYDYATGKSMVYNKENLLNNWFTVK